MCPFRITWYIAPEGDPRGSPSAEPGRPGTIGVLPMIASLTHRYYRYGTVSYRNLFPRCACDPGHIQVPAVIDCRSCSGAPSHFSERTVVRVARMRGATETGRPDGARRRPGRRPGSR